VKKERENITKKLDFFIKIFLGELSSENLLGFG